MELDSFTVQLLLDPKRLATHDINDLLQISLVEASKLRLITFK
jgi:hypothetical protein